MVETRCSEAITGTRGADVYGKASVFATALAAPGRGGDDGIGPRRGMLHSSAPVQFFPKSWRQRIPGYKVHKFAALLPSEGPMEHVCEHGLALA